MRAPAVAVVPTPVASGWFAFVALAQRTLREEGYNGAANDGALLQRIAQISVEHFSKPATNALQLATQLAQAIVDLGYLMISRDKDVIGDLVGAANRCFSGEAVRRG